MNKRVVKNEFYYPSKDGTTQIHALEWIPEGKVVADATFTMFLFDPI